jgi:hypothetical protein
MNRISTAILLLAAIFASACATVGGIQNAPLDAGNARVFPVSFDSTLKAAREAVIEAGLQIESAREVEPGTWIIVGKKGVSGFSWGELVRVAVARQEERSTRVTVHTQRRVATNVTAKGDYSETIFSNMTLKLR